MVSYKKKKDKKYMYFCRNFIMDSNLSQNYSKNKYAIS